MFTKNNSRSGRDSRSTNTRSSRRGEGDRNNNRKSFNNDFSKTKKRSFSSFSSDKKRNEFKGERNEVGNLKKDKKSFRDFSKKSFSNNNGTRSTFKKDVDYKKKENFSKNKNTERGSGEEFSSSRKFYNNRGGGRGYGRGRSGGGRKNSVFNDITKFIKKSTRDNREYTEEIYIPENNFADLDIDQALKNNILASGYKAPTLIQDKSIPEILNGRDIVGIANTGTGKTASFLIPLIDKAIKNNSEKIIILAPTRELAVQIDEEFKKFKKGIKLWSICAVGGVPIYRQLKDFRYEYNFLIGTPGRVRDLINREVVDLKEFSTIVLDESDRMLDMGFVDDMKFLMRGIREGHQTIFFSATVSPAVDKIIREFLVDPVSISVKTRDTAESIDQDIVNVNGKEKYDVLNNLLKESAFEKTIIFMKTKSGVDKLFKKLKEDGHSVTSIHGDKRPRERNFSLKDFKESKVNILIATDVAARGLDISDISHVINYDLPSTYEDYIHRIGRTGRAGKAGKALTFVE